MGTKNEPGQFDCYLKAEPDEPMFILLARDASAPALVELWAAERERHGEEAGVVSEARECAGHMRAWRDHNREPVSGKPITLNELIVRLQNVDPAYGDVPVMLGGGARRPAGAVIFWEGRVAIQ